MLKVERPWKHSCFKDLITFKDTAFHCSSIHPGPAITQHVIHLLLALILSLCRDSIPISALPSSSFFLFLSYIPSLFLLSHTHKKKLITTQLYLYGYSKPLILWEREAEMLAAIKPQNCSMSNRDRSLLCATVGSLTSNRPRNPFVITTYLALAQSFGD